MMTVNFKPASYIEREDAYNVYKNGYIVMDFYALKEKDR